MKNKTYCYEDWGRHNCINFEEKDDYINRRMAIALNCYEVALFSIDNEMYDFCADRLYFTLLNASRALLLSINKETGDFHTLVLRMYLNFVLKGLWQKKDYELLIDVYNLRQKTSFAPFVYSKKENVEPYLKPVKDLLERVCSHLNIEPRISRSEHK